MTGWGLPEGVIPQDPGWFSNRGMAGSELGSWKGGLAAELLSFTHITCTALGPPHVLVLSVYLQEDCWLEPKQLGTAGCGPIWACTGEKIGNSRKCTCAWQTVRTRFQFTSATPVSSTGLGTCRSSQCTRMNPCGTVGPVQNVHRDIWSTPKCPWYLIPYQNVHGNILSA